MGHLDDMQTLPWEEKLFTVGVLYISDPFSIGIAINFTLSLQGTRVHPCVHLTFQYELTVFHI